MISFKNFFSFQKNRFFWLNLIAMIVFLVATCLGTLSWLDSYTHHGESYVVPNVKDRTVEEAQKLFANQLLKCKIIDSSYVKGARPGIVLDQKPISGARVKEGRTVYLTITAKNVPLIKLPDLIDNSSLRQASAKLNSMGFKLTEPELVSGEQDWVYGIKYKGKDLATGDKVPHESILTLCVGNISVRDSLQMLSDSLRIDSMKIEEEITVDNSWF